MTRKTPLAFVIASIPILLTVTACATGSPVINNFCLLYKPVYVSRSADFLSPETQRMIDGNNAVWLEKCG